MKRLFLIMTMLLLASSAFAQTEDPKGFQWGLAYKRDILMTGGTSSFNATAGYRFNRGNYLGFQTGFALPSLKKEIGFNRMYYGIPLLADYIHYFPMGKKKRNAFFSGVEAGGYLYVFPAQVINDHQYESSTSLGYYAGVKAGFDFNIADFTHLQIGALFLYPGLGVSAGLTF
jgi:hypothetical protein